MELLNIFLVGGMINGQVATLGYRLTLPVPLVVQAKLGAIFEGLLVWCAGVVYVVSLVYTHCKNNSL